MALLTGKEIQLPSVGFIRAAPTATVGWGVSIAIASFAYQSLAVSKPS